jgi:hypothetical protein
MQDKIIDCADAFQAISELAPGAFGRAKDARFAYDQKRAAAWMRILKESEKKPSDETLKMMVALEAKAEQEEVRQAEADLDAVKFHFQLVQATLSAYQTAAKFEGVERDIAAAGGYGA